MNPYSRPGIPMVKAVVMHYYGIPPETFHSKSRKGKLVEARFITWYFEKRSGRTLVSLAWEYSKTHASIIYGIRMVDNWLLVDKAFSERFQKVESLIYYPVI
jgi:chromosomal replication initiation ATPase DnaA